MTAPAPLLIAGGGIAGLAVALALARIGRPSRVLERRPEFSEAGAGIQISPNGVRVLQQLGVADSLAPFVGVPEAIVVRHGASGRILQRLPLGAWIASRHGAPYWVAHRRDLQAALLTACRTSSQIEVMNGRAVELADVVDGRVVVRCAGGDTLEGSALIGADGLFSTLRDVVAPGQRPTSSGRTAARTVVASDDVPAGIDRASTGVWLAPGAHVVHYPVRAGREIALVVVREEGWREQEWSAPVSAEGVGAAVVSFAPELRSLVALGRDWRRWALFECRPLPRWSNGPRCLIGDAAHPTLPFFAQGGVMALEDGATLAAAVKSATDMASAFAQLGELRGSRTTRIVETARRNGHVFHLSGPMALARDVALRAMSGERVMSRYDWVYGWRCPSL